MAFTQANFGPVGGNAHRGKAPQMFAYTSGTDNLATVKASGYFDTVANMLEAGDVILFNDSAASAGVDFITVAAVTAGVVTTETADINSA